MSPTKNLRKQTPRKMSRDALKTLPLYTRLPKRFHDILTKEAVDRHQTLSQIVREYLEFAIQKKVA